MYYFKCIYSPFHIMWNTLLTSSHSSHKNVRKTASTLRILNSCSFDLDSSQHMNLCNSNNHAWHSCLYWHWFNLQSVSSTYISLTNQQSKMCFKYTTADTKSFMKFSTKTVLYIPKIILCGINRNYVLPLQKIL